MMRRANRTISLRRLLAVLLSLVALTAGACGSSSSTTDDAAGDLSLDPAAVAFLEDARTLLANVSTAGSRVAEVLERADVSSEAWRGEALSTIAALRAELAGAELLPDPDSMRDVRTQLLDATRQYDAASALFAGGIRDLDLDKIEEAAGALATAIVDLASARAALDAAARP